ncbi:hypothetical protein HHI36_000335 [Cryptolaemus montrouzieri]|uniref:Reverse transcriptase domain-containing protein n=1 Tax=Cryptolaemus montrouzieri TaxID=559131 RepID=A0ABD2P4K8_9CUCU
MGLSKTFDSKALNDVIYIDFARAFDSPPPRRHRGVKDFSKAFNCVQHEILLEKLKACGIRDKQLDLVVNHLEARKQGLVVNTDGIEYTSSEKKAIGVP